MSFRLTLARLYLPRFVRRQEFRRLVALTAEAFETPYPALAGRSFEEQLDAYARWMKEQAALATVDESRIAAVRTRLRDRALEFGHRLRKKLGVRTRRELFPTARLLYRVLLIDFEGAETGEIIFRRCFFSRSFTPETCALIASLDEGILAGLSGGGRLEFSARITEGNDVCRARFVFPEDVT